MAKKAESSRGNQRLRTRKDLLAAAGRLLKQGRTPDMDEVAREAMVSRATAYRYFPTVESLLIEAPLEGAAPDPQALFVDEKSTDPVARVEQAEVSMHEMAYRNASQLRLMLAAALERKAKASENGDGIPVRQNRRTPLIQAALAPARRRFTNGAYDKLCAALALVFGTESMIVFEDVLGIDEATARKVKSWTIRALVHAALEESARKK